MDQTVEEWIVEVTSPGYKDKPCDAISLLHQRPNQTTPQEELTKRFGDGKTTAQMMARMIVGKAESFSRGLPGVQQWWLYAFFGSDQPGARHPFTVQGAVDYGPLGTDAPSGNGRVTQDMRHLESMFQKFMAGLNDARQDSRFAMQLIATHAGRLMESFDKLSTENESMRDGLFRMALEQQRSEQDQMMKIEQYKRQTSERAELFKLLPPLAGTLLPGLIPQSVEDTAIVEKLFESAGKEAVFALAQSQQGNGGEILASRAKRYFEAKEKAEAERAQVAGATEELGLSAKREFGA